MYFEAANFDGKVSSPTHGTLAMEEKVFAAGSAMGTVGRSLHVRGMKCSEWFTGD